MILAPKPVEFCIMAGLVLAEDIPDIDLVLDIRQELEEEEQREGLDESYLLDEGDKEEEEEQEK